MKKVNYIKKVGWLIVIIFVVTAVVFVALTMRRNREP